MEEFEEYLHLKNYKRSTITEILNSVNQFKDWQKIAKIRKPTYQDVLSYLSEKQITSGAKNNIATHLRKYFEYLIRKGQRKDNPATGIKVRSDMKAVLKLISTKELDQVYENYRTRPLRLVLQRETHFKFLSLLGLITYQALTIKELKLLRKEDIDLLSGEINIPQTDRSNRRTLKLEARQITILMKYLEQVEEQLFTSKIEDLQDQLMEHLKGLGYRTHTLKQFRESRIMIWLRTHSIRQVQYMTGFKYISSLQRYKEQDIEGLKEKVRMFHPLG